MSQWQPTTVVGCGGGLNHYQPTAADGGTAVVLGSIVPSEGGSDSAPAAERERSAPKARGKNQKSMQSILCTMFPSSL